jgi:hypothetical protein
MVLERYGLVIYVGNGVNLVLLVLLVLSIVFLSIMGRVVDYFLGAS